MSQFNSLRKMEDVPTCVPCKNWTEGAAICLPPEKPVPPPTAKNTGMRLFDCRIQGLSVPFLVEKLQLKYLNTTR